MNLKKKKLLNYNKNEFKSPFELKFLKPSSHLQRKYEKIYLIITNLVDIMYNTFVAFKKHVTKKNKSISFLLIPKIAKMGITVSAKSNTIHILQEKDWTYNFWEWCYISTVNV